MSLDSIASQRGVQLSTVQSYIAESMTAGYAYPWHRLGVPHTLLASLCGHLNAFYRYQQQPVQLLRQSEGQQQQHIEGQQQQQQQSTGQELQLQVQQSQQAETVTQQQLGARRGPQNQAEAETLLHQQETHLQQHTTNSVPGVQHAGCSMQPGGSALASLPPPLQHLQRQMPQHWSAPFAQAVAKQAKPSQTGGGLLAVGSAQQQDLAPANSEHSCAPQQWLQPDGTMTLQVQAMQTIDEVGHVSQQGVQLMSVGLLEELVTTGQSTKALKEWMGPDAMSYGQMQIALAHLFRLTRPHTRLQ